MRISDCSSDVCSSDLSCQLSRPSSLAAAARSALCLDVCVLDAAGSDRGRCGTAAAAGRADNLGRTCDAVRVADAGLGQNKAHLAGRRKMDGKLGQQREHLRVAGGQQEGRSPPRRIGAKIGRANVCTQGTHAHILCRRLREKKKKKKKKEEKK